MRLFATSMLLILRQVSPFKNGAMVFQSRSKVRNYIQSTALYKRRFGIHNSMNNNQAHFSSKRRSKGKKRSDVLPMGEGPFAYHQEIILKITNLTNLGDGIAHVEIPQPSLVSNSSNESTNETTNELPSPSNYVVMVPQVMPGEVVRARVWQNRKTYSNADLLEVLEPSPDRIKPICPLFGQCGGCQYQFMGIDQQRKWKRNHVEETLSRIGQFTHEEKGFPCEVNTVVGTDEVFGYRTKLTPHHHAPNSEGVINAIGFQRSKVRGSLVDVENCPIATNEINEELGRFRQKVKDNAIKQKQENSEKKKKRVRGATLLLRHHKSGVSTDSNEEVEEEVKGKFFDLVFKFRAGEFFQNNPYILPLLVDHVIQQALQPMSSNKSSKYSSSSFSAETPSTKTISTTTHHHQLPKYLLDTYCGGGLFALAAAQHFNKCIGIEVSKLNIAAATRNAQLNNISNCKFVAGTAEDIFLKVSSTSDSKTEIKTSRSNNDNNDDDDVLDGKDTVVVVDPPRAGCSFDFLTQLILFAPFRIIYVSCNPATQARDARILYDAGYMPTNVTPFDLFPQTRHIENVITFEK